MTFVEVLIVISLIAIISLSLYNALSNGLRVWKKTRELVIEEDIAVFFEKLTKDLRNSYPYSQIPFEATENKFAFPTIVKTIADEAADLPKGELVEQVVRVQYVYDYNNDTITKSVANYSQALQGTYGSEMVLVRAISKLTFRYIYLTKDGEIKSTEASNVFPSSLEVEVEFFDKGKLKKLRKLIDIPIGL